jgi:Flp pilus assembly protein TadG
MVQLRQASQLRVKGSSLVELVVGLIILIPIMLVIVDIGVIVIDVQINDSTCREAARVASTGNPIDAQARAMAIINRANKTPSSMLSNFRLVNLESTVSEADMQALSTYGGQVAGTVAVTTEVNVRPLVVQTVFSGKSPLHFYSKQSFPFTYVMPNTASSTP